MSIEEKTIRHLEAEIEELRLQLAEAKETIEAIRHGGVDALLVDSSGGPQVYMLSGADQPYRVMVEEMQEGAVTLREDGIIVYCNKQIAQMLGATHQDLLGKPFRGFLTPASLPLFEALLSGGRNEQGRGEVVLQSIDGTQVPILLAVKRLPMDNQTLTSVVIADLTEQKRHQELMASEAFSSSILDQAMDGVVVCNQTGRVIRANQAALRLCGVNPLLQPFHAVFPLRSANKPDLGDPRSDNRDDELSLFPLVSNSQFLRGVEAALVRADGQRVDLLLSVGKLLDPERKELGSIVTMTDITDRKRAEESLRQLNAQQEAANKSLRAAAINIMQDADAARRQAERAEEALRRHGAELQAMNDELARFNRVAVDRELRMIELKKEINALCAQIGQQSRYPLDFEKELK